MMRHNERDSSKPPGETLSNRESSFISMLYKELLLIRAQEGVILVHKLRDAVICVN